MNVKQLIAQLNRIIKVHPEVEEAQVWVGKLRVTMIGYDRRHKPARIKLCE